MHNTSTSEISAKFYDSKCFSKNMLSFRRKYTSSFKAAKTAVKLSACARKSSKPTFPYKEEKIECRTITSASATAAMSSFSTICQKKQFNIKYQFFLQVKTLQILINIQHMVLQLLDLFFTTIQHSNICS